MPQLNISLNKAILALSNNLRYLSMTQKELEADRIKEGLELKAMRHKLLLSAREVCELANGTLTIRTIYKIEQGKAVAFDTFLIYRFTLNNINNK